MALSLLIVAGGVAGAQETRCQRGGVEVGLLEFTGNEAFTDAELAAGIVTSSSSWTRRTIGFLGTRHCLNAREFPLDVARLRLWYRNHGYVDVRVDTVVTNLTRNRVGVRFVIDEGEPIRVDTVRVTGLDAVPERAEVLLGLRTRPGGLFDRYANAASRDSISRRLRDNGYPDAEVFLGYDTRTLERTATVIFDVEPGVRTRIGDVAVVQRGVDGGEAKVDERAVRRLIGIRNGELYRERSLERAKRTLYQTEAFTRVDVEPGVTQGDSLITINVALTEDRLRAARVGGGWGSLDCFRMTGDYTDYNIFRSATRLELGARVSKIGIGDPLGGAASLCPQARDDIYSENLNYYVGATLSQPSLLRASFVPTLSIFSERRSEYNAFLRTIPVGASVSLVRTMPRRTLGTAYSLEYGRTEAQPALFCAVFNACELADRQALQATQRLAVLSVSTGYERTDDPIDPRHGLVGRAEARHASRFVGADAALEFSRLTVDGSLYTPLGEGAVFAMRLRLGVVLGASFAFDEAARFVPPQERLFAGGPTTVRGFRQNELGPLVYIPTSYDTVGVDGGPVGAIGVGDTVYLQANALEVGQRPVPTGGNTLLVGNAEIRLNSPFLPNLLRWTLFADFGEVWSRGGPRGLGFDRLRVTPGFGVRIRTPIGFIRADLAYNGYERSGGAAYFDAPVAEGGSLYCVSPGNQLPVVSVGGRLVQAEGDCPSSFRPSRPSGFFGRLTPSIAIGQAF